MTQHSLFSIYLVCVALVATVVRAKGAETAQSASSSLYHLQNHATGQYLSMTRASNLAGYLHQGEQQHGPQPLIQPERLETVHMDDESHDTDRHFLAWSWKELPSNNKENLIGSLVNAQRDGGTVSIYASPQQGGVYLFHNFGTKHSVGQNPHTQWIVSYIVQGQDCNGTTPQDNDDGAAAAACVVLESVAASGLVLTGDEGGTVTAETLQQNNNRQQQWNLIRVEEHNG